VGHDVKDFESEEDSKCLYGFATQFFERFSSWCSLETLNATYLPKGA